MSDQAMKITKSLSPARNRFVLFVAWWFLFPFASARAGSTYTLTADGAWTWFNDPRAIYINNNIYTGWVDSTGHIIFAGHNLASHVTTTATLYNGNFFQSDDHDNPAFLLNSPTSLTAFYSP